MKDVLSEATRRCSRTGAPTDSPGLRAALEADLAYAEHQLRELYDDRASGGYGTTMGRRRFLELEQSLGTRIETTTAQLAGIGTAMAPEPPTAGCTAESSSDPIGPGSWWANAFIDERRAVLTLLIGRITISKSPAGHTRPPVESRVTIEWLSSDG